MRHGLQGMGCSKLLAEGGIGHTNFKLNQGFFLIGVQMQSYGKIQKKSQKIGEDRDEKHFTFIRLFI